MESLSVGLSISQLQLSLLKTQNSLSKSVLPVANFSSHFRNSSSHTPPSCSRRIDCLEIQNLQPRIPVSTRFHCNSLFLKPYLSFLPLGFIFPLSCFASETSAVASEEVPTKINLESVLVSIDDFFNRYPFFVAGVSFIWLAVIPLVQEYLKKYKFISAIDAFRKLRDDPNCQLLDIRGRKSLAVLDSPNLKILKKSVLQVEFRDGDDDGYVKQVLDNLEQPENTVICILDKNLKFALANVLSSKLCCGEYMELMATQQHEEYDIVPSCVEGSFDGNSMKVAELLVSGGIKEAYAIKGGIRGKKGWQEIQETLLPPSVHIYSKKAPKRVSQKLMNDGKDDQRRDISSKSSTSMIGPSSSGTINNSNGSLSPYPNYPDLKPPSSPTPSKPER